MKRFLSSLTLGASLLVATQSVFAQTNATAYPIEPTAGLYQAFGEKAGLQALMDDFVQRLAADPKIGEQFKGTPLPRLAQLLTEQTCELSGGPCRYSGRSMAQSHTGLKITAADFNRLVEVFQVSMDAKGIPFNRQNQMLALLAPMHRDIVTVR